MTDERAKIEQLIDALGTDVESAEWAQLFLIRIGSTVVDALCERTPALPRFGKLCAIEVLREAGEPRAGSALIAMLRDEDETVREWAADALGELGVAQAAPDLERLYDEIKASDAPLDWTFPVGVRRALADLGARTVVMPATVAEMAGRDEKLGLFWEPQDLSRVISELAEARQLIVELQTRLDGR